jgi:hypothetical protein
MAKTEQGNRMGRGAVIESKCAAVSGEFGMAMLRKHFAEDADAILAALGAYSRGPRKGLPRGYVHWEKVVEGGFDYRDGERCVISQRGARRWRVLDGADAEYSKNIGAEVAAARVVTADAVRRARLAPRADPDLFDQAMRAHRGARKLLRDAYITGDAMDMDHFLIVIRCARKLLREARNHAKPITLGERLIPGCTCGWPEACRCD